jgi:energy-coupling factor transporter ATP-binding protein EcfA2
MKLLVKIHLVQFFLYEKREVSIGQFTGVFGANGSGKSSLLDAVQIVMLGANQSRGRSGVSFNAQADEGGQNTRSIRSYCLGQYGDSPDARVRQNATSYVTLVWYDTVTKEYISTGVCIAASSNRDKHEVLGRYVAPIALTLNDHLESVESIERPRSWNTFRQSLQHRAGMDEEVLFHDSDRFISAMLFALRGSRGAASLDAFRQSFRFGLRMKFDKSVDDIVRNQVLEARPTNVKRFREVLQTFQDVSALVREVEGKLMEAELIEADYAEADRKYRQGVTLSALAQSAAREVANEEWAKAEEDEGNASQRLDRAREMEQAAAKEVANAVAHEQECTERRDKHASHADTALLREQVVQAEARMKDRQAAYRRTLLAINSALDVKIPGKLISRGAEAVSIAQQGMQILLDEEKAPTRENIERHVRAALRALKGLSDEIFKEMQDLGSEISRAESELQGMRENQERISKGKPPLDRKVSDLKRALADEGIDATPVCDMVRVEDPLWQPVIESYLGSSNLQALVVEGDTASERKAFAIARGLRIFGAKVVMPSKFTSRPSPKRGTVAELIAGNNAAAVNYLRHKLGETFCADTEDECFSHRFALTKDGMFVSDGEFSRFQPTDPVFFKIGPTSNATRTAIADEIRRLESRVNDLKQTYADTKIVLGLVSSFTGGENDKVQSLLEDFDRVRMEVESHHALVNRLASLDTEEYLQLDEAVKQAKQAVEELRAKHLQAATAVGAADADIQQRQNHTAKCASWVSQQTDIADRARQQEGFDADYASEQWEKLLNRNELVFREADAELKRRAREAQDLSRRKADSGSARLGAFTQKYQEFLPSEARGDWRLSRAWLTARVEKLSSTRLNEYKPQMEAALITAQNTFRNDVAVAQKENLDWLSDTMDRMNSALRSAPTFTNGERYRFHRTVRPAYANLLKFIKDVADYGPGDDLFGGAGEMPPEFAELIREKSVPGSAAIKSPLDDYREYFDFDIEVLRETADGGLKHVGWLSKRVGSGSGGEHRAPLYVIAGAAMTSAYRLERGDESGIRLLVVDEAFIKMDGRNIVAIMRYFEELGLQVFMASTGDALGTLTAFLHRYYDIMRDAESNVVLLEGHDVDESVRQMFRADWPELNPELLANEIAKQYQPPHNLLPEIGGVTAP